MIDTRERRIEEGENLQIIDYRLKDWPLSESRKARLLYCQMEKALFFSEAIEVSSIHIYTKVYYTHFIQMIPVSLL